MDHSSRLEEALSIFLAWEDKEPRIPAQELLTLHPDLGEYLRPLLEDAEQEGAGEERSLGDYHLGRELGRGGMGVVFEAWQVSLSRPAAIKILAAQLTHNPTTLARFRREAMTAARLQHPGIVGVLGYGAEGETHFLAMELVRGAPLDQVIKALQGGSWRELNGMRVAHAVSKAIETIHGSSKDSSKTDTDTASQVMSWSGGYVQTVVNIVAQIADTLDYAHREGVIHRDVKPSNILLREDGRAVLTDFGLAREESLPSLTMTGDFAGSPYYVSPEQALAKGGIDRRTDVFSLGTTLYELLTFQRPFEAPNTHEIISRILHKEPLDPQKLNPALAPDLAAIVLKALEKRTDQRYQTASDFAADLRAFLEYRPVQARHPTVLARVGRWLRREPLKAAFTAATLLLLGLAGYVFSSQEATAAGREAIQRGEIDGLLAQAYSRMLNVRPNARDAGPFEAVLELDPGNPYAIAGRLWIHRGAEPGSKLAFLEAQRVPGRGERAIARMQAVILRELGRSEDADSILQELGEPRGSLDLFVDGLQYLPATAVRSYDDFKVAVDRFVAAIYQSPSANFLYLMQLAYAASRCDDLENAVYAADAMIELWPDVADAWIYAGIALTWADTEKAIEYFQKAAVIDPDNDLVYRNLALAQSSAGDLDAAMATIEKAISIDDSASASHSILSMYQMRRAGEFKAKNEVDEAELWFDEAVLSAERAVELAPGIAQYHADLGAALERAGDPEGAMAEALESIRIEPKYGRGHRSVLGLARIAGDLPAQRREHERWLGIHENDATAHREFADFLIAAGEDEADQELALEYANLAIELSQAEDPWCLLTLARAEDRYGDSAAADQALEQLQAVLPEDPRARAELLSRIAEFKRGR